MQVITGCAMVQAMSPLSNHRLTPSGVHVGFVVKRVVLLQVFL